MSKATTFDLGQGSVGKHLLRLSLPTIAAQLVNMLYNIIDRIYIGHIPDIGATALTGVGVTFPIIMLIAAFSGLFGIGGAPLAAIKMGAQENDKAEQILGNSFSALCVTSIVLTVFFLTFNRPLLLLFGASSDTIDYAYSYITIYTAGTIFVQFALGLNAYISTQGFSTVSMATVVIGAILNIVLDPIFIFGLHMGVQGAALATIISQGVSAIWVLKFLTGNRTKLKIKKSNLRIRPKIVLSILALGVSPFIMQSTESLVNIVLNSSLQRYGGDIAVGAMSILNSVMQILWMTLSGLTQGAQPLISYNYGAQKIGRVKTAFRLTLISALCLSIVFFTAVELFPQIFAALFSDNQALIDKSAWALRIFMGGTFALGAQSACQQTFMSLGQAKTSLLLALLRKIVLLIPLALILPLFFTDKVFGVFFAEPVADLLAVAVTVTTFIIQSRKFFRTPPKPAE